MINHKAHVLSMGIYVPDCKVGPKLIMHYSSTFWTGRKETTFWLTFSHLVIVL